ncbi:aldo/keto reductase [Defluviicoccus vanus]|nr:aldo/keto reductase [Defluviicoccus vanus]
MSWAYGAADESEAIATIHHAIDRGVTLFDTAEMYGPFTNERLLGRAIAGQRDRLVIATKFGFRFNKDNVATGTDSRPEHVREVCDASLGRLGIEVIDLFYQHRVDRAVPIEDTVGAMADLVRAGKVRYLGLSEASAATIRRAHAVHPITALQSEWSLWERDIEAEILPTLRELGIALVPFSPLGRGFLTGQARPAEDYPASDYRRQDPRLQVNNFAANMRLVDAVRVIAVEKAATPAQIALAWLLAQGEDVVPIPGTKRRHCLDENLRALDLRLSKDDLARIAAAAPPGGTAGPRYGERMMALVDR